MVDYVKNEQGSKDSTVDATVINGSSEDMPQLDNGEVELIVTSPPYNVGYDYGDYDDKMSYRDEYLAMLARVFTECWRVLRDGGKMCVNVPSVVYTQGSYIPLSADIQHMVMGKDISTLDHEDIQRMRSNTNWSVRTVITWVKPIGSAMDRPRGSYPRPWGINIEPRSDDIIVFEKPGRRRYSLSEEVIKESKIDIEHGSDLLTDAWEVKAGNKIEIGGNSIPAFNPEIPRRLIKLYSYKTDLVLDPFMGAGTTLIQAKKMGRNSIGYELRDEVAEYAREQLSDVS